MAGERDGVREMDISTSSSLDVAGGGQLSASAPPEMLDAG